MAKKIQCGASHTVYQPGDTKWRCPKCGVKGDDEKPFIVEEPTEAADSNCPKLHNDDYCVCSACDFSGTGKKVAKMLMALDHQMVCPTCKGKGTVAEGK
jgi:hypothetical protein